MNAEERKGYKSLINKIAMLGKAWWFYCACGNKWSSMATPTDEKAPIQSCRACRSLVKGGL